LAAFFLCSLPAGFSSAAVGDLGLQGRGLLVGGVELGLEAVTFGRHGRELRLRRVQLRFRLIASGGAERDAREHRQHHETLHCSHG
jgi:hypothetical protein